MTAEQKAIRADLDRLITSYTRKKRVYLIDTIEALGEIIEDKYSHILPTPKADKGELTQLLTEYADNNGIELDDLLEELDAVLEQRIDRMISKGTED